MRGRAVALIPLPSHLATTGIMVPGQEVALRQRSHREQYYPHDGQHDHRGEDPGSLELRGRPHHEVSEASARTHPLTYHRPNHADRDGDLGSREEEWKRGRKLGLSEDLPPRGAHA